MRRRARSVWLWTCALATFLVAPAAVAYEDQVVALQVTRQLWDEYRPWQKRNAETRSGSAVVLEGGLPRRARPY